MTLVQPPTDRGLLLHRPDDDEWALRVTLAAAFRLGYHLDWNRVISNHISARVPGRPDWMLMNPYGLGWNEITASAIVTVDLGGRILSHAEAELAPAGFNFHSGILKARPDLNSTIHVHAAAGVVIACTMGGLVIVDQTGCHIHGEVGYHEFEGFAQEEDEVPRILRDLGDKHLLIMRNHGLLSVGSSVQEAFMYMRRLIAACELQERLMATGAEIRPIPQEVLDLTRRQIVQKKQKRSYSDVEWRSYLRLAESLDPGFAR
ncbi:class II aldolase/adducin family protein [Inquilinus sp. CA228]|uniref:class II aldolase/adducin family protein n=1 Tax=Inquilinus sp. CA228 TaxID=3455609 RepID=UPI003F8D5F10